MSYKRVLLKISGEALAGEKHFGFDYDVMAKICEQIKIARGYGTQFGIVIGGGNFWRGRESVKNSGAIGIKRPMDRVRADQIGMLATIMNAVAFGDLLESFGVETQVYSSIPMEQVAVPYIRDSALRRLEKGCVAILSGGTGLPYFSTDTAAALRAVELRADVFMKATMVDGVYDKDPKKFADAVKFEELTHGEILEKDLKVLDATAASLCNENHMKLLVFNLNPPSNIVRAVRGENIGTIVNTV